MTTANQVRTVTFVAAPAAVSDLCPNQFSRLTPEQRQKILAVELEVDPSKCSTRLGRWFAERITSTLLEDNPPSTLLETGFTEADKNAEALIEKIEEYQEHSIRDAVAADRFLDEISGFVVAQRKQRALQGAEYFRPYSKSYNWPVFGSRAAWGATTPEEYFDLCANAILRMRPNGASIGSERVPADLLNGNQFREAA
jgi:hypothetical protein